MRRYGFMLAGAGLLGMLFFWLTDPRYGFVKTDGRNPIDAANEAMIPTLVGIVGSLVVLLIGLWLVTRRTV